ncbi:MAG: hypothetical protein GWN84_00765 [Gammaproteobacteria bacterium]|nr:hypothetical protein [Gammaproteobacteria bacterium]NIR81730.1 hypothetical protein [Gammaproteobacteria bacterium]NIR88533.1 hypothetical protein [Gammaproteobacteria bacterium]NIU02837.1 hypothetical protein [Gammaproteobacteria bacterium]NIV50359.1 hypothetical protein [Gammaproteobacteria bacterium]
MNRLLFYCHNVYGLGHVVRSLRIAEAALETAPCETAVITGCRFLDAVPRDARIRVERLPAVTVGRGGGFQAAEPGVGGDVIAQRARAIRAFVEEWRPDVVLVDHHPFGLGGELVETLTAAAEGRLTARFVWGIPYSEGGAYSLRRPGNPRLSRALHQYVLALGYTDPCWIDAFAGYRDYGLPPRCENVGFVIGRLPAHRPPRLPRIVALCGGGAGAETFFRLLLAATETLDHTTRPRLRLVIGPFGDRGAVARLARGRSHVEIWPDGAAEAAMADGDMLVARAGYNTAFTAVASPLPVCFVPYRTVDEEQTNRARRLARLENVWVVAEDDADAPRALAAALGAGLRAGPAARDLPFWTDGAEVAARHLLSLTGLGVVPCGVC